MEDLLYLYYYLRGFSCGFRSSRVPRVLHGIEFFLILTSHLKTNDSDFTMSLIIE